MNNALLTNQIYQFNCQAAPLGYAQLVDRTQLAARSRFSRSISEKIVESFLYYPTRYHQVFRQIVDGAHPVVSIGYYQFVIATYQ